jgi:hypothetical protein
VDELRKPTLRKHSQRIFDELYDDFSGIVEGSEIETQDNRDEDDKEKEPKSVENSVFQDSTVDFDPNDSTLDQEQINEFKGSYDEAEDTWDYRSLAEEIAQAGDKKWAKYIYVKAESLAEDVDDMKSIAESVADEDGLNDKELSREYFQKAVAWAESSEEFYDLAVSLSDFDKEWSKELATNALNLPGLNEYGAFTECVRIILDKDWLEALDKEEFLPELVKDQSYKGVSFEFEVVTDIVTEINETYSELVSTDHSKGKDDWEKHLGTWKTLIETIAKRANNAADYLAVANAVQHEYSPFEGDEKIEFGNKYYTLAYEHYEEVFELRDLLDDLCGKEWYQNEELALKCAKKGLQIAGTLDQVSMICFTSAVIRFPGEILESAYEKAMSLSGDANEDDIKSFSDKLKMAGELEKAFSLPGMSALDLDIGIKYDVSVGGSTILKCGFDIDWNYREEMTGDDSGPDSFHFHYDFKKGKIISYDSEDHESDYVRPPHQNDKDSMNSFWYVSTPKTSISIHGDWHNDDEFNDMINGDIDFDEKGDDADELLGVLKSTLDGKSFKQLILKVCPVIRDHMNE